MLTLLRETRRLRLLAALAASLFGAIVLIAAAPHGHAASPGPAAAQGPAFANSVPESPSCTLCDWLTPPGLAPPLRALLLALALHALLDLAALPERALRAASVRRSSRAPPRFAL